MSALDTSALSGSSLGSYLYNAATGNLSQAQVQSLTQQETNSLVQAGVPLPQAQEQAASDVHDTLSSFVGSGGLGITWTGALPTQGGFGTATTNAVSNWFAQNWIWFLLAGLAVLLFLSVR